MHTREHQLVLLVGRTRRELPERVDSEQAADPSVSHARHDALPRGGRVRVRVCGRQSVHRTPETVRRDRRGVYADSLLQAGKYLALPLLTGPLVQSAPEAARVQSLRVQRVDLHHTGEEMGHPLLLGGLCRGAPHAVHLQGGGDTHAHQLMRARQDATGPVLLGTLAEGREGKGDRSQVAN